MFDCELNMIPPLVRHVFPFRFQVCRARIERVYKGLIFRGGNLAGSQLIFDSYISLPEGTHLPSVDPKGFSQVPYAALPGGNLFSFGRLGQKTA